MIFGLSSLVPISPSFQTCHPHLIAGMNTHAEFTVFAMEVIYLGMETDMLAKTTGIKLE